MIQDTMPVWKEDVWTPFGKWMDGWETRRKRTIGHDWCIIKLPLPSIPSNIVVDTAFFTGNYSPKIRIQGLSLFDYRNSVETQETIEKLIQIRQKSRLENPAYGRMGTKSSQEEDLLVSQLSSKDWKEILPFSPLGSGVEENRLTKFVIDTNSCNESIFKEGIILLRVSMGPDGGIARLKFNGKVVEKKNLDFKQNDLLELSSILYGSKIVQCSDQHYGNPSLMLLKEDGKANYEGWQTSRQPLRPISYDLDSQGLLVEPGSHYVDIKLGLSGRPDHIIIDTTSFIGNPPESIKVEAWDKVNNKWVDLLERILVGPDSKFTFKISENFKVR